MHDDTDADQMAEIYVDGRFFCRMVRSEFEKMYEEGAGTRAVIAKEVEALARELMADAGKGAPVAR